MRLLLPEAADSSLTHLGDENVERNRSVKMRLRLQTLFSILLGEQIFVSEGWALDSVAMLEVCSEVFDSVKRLQKLQTRPNGITSFSPFRIELRREQSYLATFRAYLERGDCKWSGYPELRKSPDEQILLAAKLGQLDTNWSSDSVQRMFAEALNDEVMGEAISSMAGYASHFGKARTAEWSRPAGTFFQSVAPFLARLRKRLETTDFEGDIADLDKLLADLGENPTTAHSSSRFLEVAKDAISPRLMPGIDHLVDRI